MIEHWLTEVFKFLRLSLSLSLSYIQSNGFSKSDKGDVPTYDEIVGDDNLQISENEAVLERQAEFEWRKVQALLKM